MMMAGVARATYMLLMPNGSPSKYQTDVTTQAPIRPAFAPRVLLKKGA